MTKFSDLGLAEPLTKALAAKGYTVPTPIQAQAIPSLLQGRDLCGIAQTGTGKTAAFALPSLDYFSRNPKPRPLQGCRMLVLSPTRELAAQIADSFRDYARFMRVSVETVFGGVPIGKQINKLRAGVDVLVATPGRLLDLIEQRALKRIDKMLPQKRQSLFFSATMPKTIAELGDRFLTDPVKVAVTPVASTAERVEQFVTFVNQSEKTALLTLTLQKEEIERALVFTRTKHGADKVVRNLQAAGIGCAAIHGNKSQPQRTQALQAFRSGEIKILIATDIAARGIDVSGVSHVFNFELPNVAEQYVHRIGRTARAGKSGIAIAYVDHEERAYLKQIERLTRIPLVPAPLPEGFEQAKASLPKPVPAKPSAPRRHDDGRSRPAGDRPTRPFRRRSGGSVGAHRGAVKRAG